MMPLDVAKRLCGATGTHEGPPGLIVIGAGDGDHVGAHLDATPVAPTALDRGQPSIEFRWQRAVPAVRQPRGQSQHTRPSRSDHDRNRLRRTRVEAGAERLREAPAEICRILAPQTAQTENRLLHVRDTVARRQRPEPELGARLVLREAASAESED